MKELGERTGHDLVGGLTPLVTAYRDWIDAQEATLSDPGRHQRLPVRRAGSDQGRAARCRPDRGWH